LAFLEGQGRAVEKVYAFFSMIDKGNLLHREQALNLYKQYARILWSPIPYLQDIERMGITREPVPAYAPGSLADKAYRDLWSEIQKKLLSK
jgi:cellulose biosynthesis protein BcsQ